MLRKVFILLIGIVILGLVGSAIAEPKSKTEEYGIKLGAHF